MAAVTTAFWDGRGGLLGESDLAALECGWGLGRTREGKIRRLYLRCQTLACGLLRTEYTIVTVLVTALSIGPPLSVHTY